MVDFKVMLGFGGVVVVLGVVMVVMGFFFYLGICFFLIIL